MVVRRGILLRDDVRNTYFSLFGYSVTKSLFSIDLGLFLLTCLTALFEQKNQSNSRRQYTSQLTDYGWFKAVAGGGDIIAHTLFLIGLTISR